ncbi:LysR family transcriptional regulator [Rhodovulum strictum]|uniref:LysR family transcriptional regulator n=1 Tax=Rhodovulum strictum TaxID=58314 RepID=A0A844BFN2_9RHOB|nr:LysR family transcriptional regulator [Rhodovulum strictum]MRH21348.1 LysR family transcriptional regulator [Rhodovulum strictum]
MPMRVTLRQFTYFVSIADAGSMSVAASHLNVAPTALSLQMKALEETLGVPLLERHSRGVRPTEAGQEFLVRARQILDLVADTRALMAARARRTKRPVRLGVPPAVARLLGVEAVLGAATALDGTMLLITEAWSTDLVKRLAEKDIDFILGYGLVPCDEIAVIDLLEEDFVFAASPAIAGGEGPVGLSEVLASDLIFYGEKSVGLRALRAEVDRAGLVLENKREVASINVWRAFLCRGLGTAVTPFGAVVDEHERGEITVREIADSPVTARLSLATRRDGLGADDVQAFIAFVTDLVLAQHTRIGSLCRVLAPAAGTRSRT